MNEVLILEGARTPFSVWKKGLRGDGREGGALAALDPFDLGAAAVKGALAKAGLAPQRVERLVFANAYHAGSQAVYGARHVSLKAGFSPAVTSLTVNLACGAGLQAVITAAQEVAVGEFGIIAAAGADSPSLVRRDVFVPSFHDWACGRPIAKTAQTLALGLGFSRSEQDAFALKSHERALKARALGYFKEEIIPVAEATEDDAILLKPNSQYFADSKILYDDDPNATAANTHAIVDGGSALLLASGGAAAGLKVIGRYLGGAIVGLAPERMAYGSVEAILKLQGLLGLKNSDVDLYEINETFASQMLIALKELKLDADRVNVNGGALALGHPFGGTGCRLVLTALHELKRRSLKRAIASICIGAGLGVAVAVETA